MCKPPHTKSKSKRKKKNQQNHNHNHNNNNNNNNNQQSSFTTDDMKNNHHKKEDQECFDTTKSNTNNGNKNNNNNNPNSNTNKNSTTQNIIKSSNQKRSKRGKRMKQNELEVIQKSINVIPNKTKKVVKKTGSLSRHEGESHSGGLDALIPSFIALIVIGCGIITKMGFRGRATVAGIDLGTTNSVICVQQQSKGSQVGEINCIPDPYNNSPIIPSVISFLDPLHYSKTKPFKKKDELGYNLDPSPSFVVVGSAAKDRIDTHPHHTLYHAKRVLGLPYDDIAVQELTQEVEFNIFKGRDEIMMEYNVISDNNTDDDDDDDDDVVFSVPFHSKNNKISTESNESKNMNTISILPHQVGSYVINHLMEITAKYLGYDNIRSAVIAVPAKFDQRRRQATVQAFKNVGIKVARILEEPVAAALAYGLQKKDNVDYILVYDFGGGTLDVSVLQVFDGGYVEVIGNDGDNRLGGADFDAAIAHAMVDFDDGFGSKVIEKVSQALINIQTAFDGKNSDVISNYDDVEEQLVSECSKLVEMPLCSLSSLHTIGEKMKIELSSLTGGNNIVSKECYGIPLNIEFGSETISDFCSILEPIEFKISTEQFESVCSSLFERSISPISRILRDVDLIVDDIDEVVMVGGTTRMPQIRELVKNELQVDILNTSIDPDLTVAYGAASVID